MSDPKTPRQSKPGAVTGDMSHRAAAAKAPRIEGGLRKYGQSKSNEPHRPLVSIVTVVFNGVRHIEQTIRSVIEQTYTPIEYIVVDGGSTDGTVGVLRKFDSMIDYWVSEPDAGVYDAMNKGIGLASGDIVGIINSDDWYEPYSVASAVRALDEFNAGLVYGTLRSHFEDGAVHYHNVEMPTGVDNLRLSACHPTIFVRRAVYEQFGAFDTRYRIAADYDFLLRVFRGGVPMIKLDEVLANFRSGGISSGGAGAAEAVSIAAEHGMSARALAFKRLAGARRRLFGKVKRKAPIVIKTYRALRERIQHGVPSEKGNSTRER